MPFVAPRTADAGAQGLLIGLNKTDLMRIAELLVLGVVAVLVLLMVVRPLLGRLLEVDEDPAEAAPGMLPAGAGHPALAGPDGSAYPRLPGDPATRSEEHTSELQSLMRISYAVFCLKKKKQNIITHKH